MKKYLKTIEDIIALKDTDTIIYRDLPEEYKDKEKVNYFKFVNGVPCWFEDEQKVVTYNVPFYLDKNGTRYYVLVKDKRKRKE